MWFLISPHPLSLSPEVERGIRILSQPSPFKGEVCLPTETAVQAGRGVK